MVPPHTPTPVEYQEGAVRQDTVTLAVAVRTNIPTPDGTLDWLVTTVDYGGYYASWDDVGDNAPTWVDIYEPLVGLLQAEGIALPRLTDPLNKQLYEYKSVDTFPCQASWYGRQAV